MLFNLKIIVLSLGGFFESFNASNFKPLRTMIGLLIALKGAKSSNWSSQVPRVFFLYSTFKLPFLLQPLLLCGESMAPRPQNALKRCFGKVCQKCMLSHVSGISVLFKHWIMSSRSGLSPFEATWKPSLQFDLDLLSLYILFIFSKREKAWRYRQKAGHAWMEISIWVGSFPKFPST